jgi:hypothetical protein
MRDLSAFSGRFTAASADRPAPAPSQCNSMSVGKKDAIRNLVQLPIASSAKLPQGSLFNYGICGEQLRRSLKGRYPAKTASPVPA